MSTVSQLNNELYREVKAGKSYDKYFSNSKCTAVYLGTGDTSFGLKKMSEATNLYQNQSKKIATKLKGKTLSSTINNIKNFLYNHIQYSADGFEQNLKSPNCTWDSKKADCKSYSLFAGTILKCLQIDFKYRKITQPSSPNKWSHVYVVVEDKNKKELIIDGTVLFQNEPNYIKKEDLEMGTNLPYYGMNAIHRIENNNEIVTKFIKFLNELNDNGVSQKTTNLIKREVKRYSDAGISPILEITDKGISVNNKFFSFNGTYIYNNAQGMGAAAILSGMTIAKGSKIVGSILKLFGGGGTPAEAFLQAGNKMVQELQAPFVQNFENNPTGAINEFEKGLAHSLGQTKSAYKNASQSKTKNGALQSRKDVENSIATLNKFINDNSDAYAFNVVRTENGTYPLGKHSTPYTYRVFDVQKKANKPVNALSLNNTNTQYNSEPVNTTGEIIDGILSLGNGVFKNQETQQVFRDENLQTSFNQNVMAKTSGAKKGIGTWAWVGIGTGAAAILGTGAYFLLKK